MYSIIIPTYNNPARLGSLQKYLIPCLESLQKYCYESSVEIIVVSNGCGKSCLEYLKNYSYKYENIKIIHTPHPLGYSKATNLGIKIASNDYIVLLNDDTVLLEQPLNLWLHLLKEPLNNVNTVISGPLVNSFEGNEFLIGFCLMVKKWFFDKYGLLDESLFPGWGEDIDLCLRAKKYNLDFKKVGSASQSCVSNNLCVGSFPIFHVGEATFHAYPELVQQSLKLHDIIRRRIKNNYYKL